MFFNEQPRDRLWSDRAASTVFDRDTQPDRLGGDGTRRQNASTILFASTAFAR
jgi:hypothetical protein